MPIIVSEIMKKIDERETQTNEKKQKRQKRKRRTKAIVKGWQLNDFVVHLMQDSHLTKKKLYLFASMKVL